MKYFLFVFALCLPTAVLAENAYSWKDSSGNTHYGNKPPQGAQSVTNLNKGISRYSSKAAMSHLRVPSTKANDANSIVEKDIPLNPINENEVIEKLQPQTVAIQYDQKWRISSCQVTVKNTAEVPINNVAVVFAFPDGSKAIGSGPKSIRDNSEEVYAIPGPQLPISLNDAYIAEKIKSSKTDEALIHEALTPRVIVGIE